MGSGSTQTMRSQSYIFFFVTQACKISSGSLLELLVQSVMCPLYWQWSIYNHFLIPFCVSCSVLHFMKEHILNNIKTVLKYSYQVTLADGQMAINSSGSSSQNPCHASEHTKEDLKSTVANTTMLNSRPSTVVRVFFFLKRLDSLFPRVDGYFVFLVLSLNSPFLLYFWYTPLSYSFSYGKYQVEPAYSNRFTHLYHIPSHMASTRRDWHILT